MSEKPLLLSPAKSGLLLTSGEPDVLRRWRYAAITFGCLVILVGGYDAASRLLRVVDTAGFSQTLLSHSIVFTAFAPAAALQDPSLLNALIPASTATSSDPLTPSKIKVPSIGVYADVELVGKKDDGSMDTPKNFNNVGWYKLGSKPGEAGNAVFAGHVNNALATAGVFAHLSEIKIGDYVTVESNNNGKTLVYVVTQLNQYPVSEAPAAQIFATTGPSQIVLITCDGDWVGSAHSFDKRLVVVARLMHP